MTIEFFLYSAQDCELCVEMQNELQNVLPESGATCHIIDIDDDIELKHRYGARIPVLVCGTHEICEVKLDLPALQDFLSAYH